MTLVRQMHPVQSMGGQVWCVLWPSRGSIDALRVVLLCPLPEPSGRLLTLDGDGAVSIEETLEAEGQGVACTRNDSIDAVLKGLASKPRSVGSQSNAGLFPARIGTTGMRRWRFQSVALSGNAGGSVPWAS